MKSEKNYFIIATNYCLDDRKKIFINLANLLINNFVCYNESVYDDVEAWVFNAWNVYESLRDSLYHRVHKDRLTISGLYFFANPLCELSARRRLSANEKSKSK